MFPLKIELRKNDEEAVNSKRKARELVEDVCKILDYIGNSRDIINKAKLFDSRLRRAGQVSKAKVITILVDYGLKMEKILKEMKTMFASLEPEAQT